MLHRFMLIGSFLVSGLVALAVTAPAASVVRYVANYGVDSPTCGTAAAPCRSITLAIEHAAPGDHVVVGPGLYGDIDRDRRSGTPGDEPYGPVAITRAVTVESSAGAAATIIELSGGEAVRITAPGAVFGQRDKGFTVRAGIGVAVLASDVTVQDNRITAGTIGVSVQAAASRVKILGNVVTGSSHAGLAIAGEHSITTNNVVERNGTGILIGGPSALLEDNHVINNTGAGVRVTADDTTVRHNVLAGNAGTGIFVAGGSRLVNGTVVVSNNFAYNGVLASFAAGTDCGVISEVSTVKAPQNFWGSAQGPGAHPADRACTVRGAIDTTAFLTRPVAIVNQTGR